MSKNYLPGLVIICSFMAAGSHAQNPTDYFTPYGFQLPNLQKGEYLVSLWGNYYDYSDKLQPENPDDINRNSSHHQYFTFRGVYAFTDILLLRVQLVFNPSRVQYEYEYANQSAVPIYRLNRQIPNSYINPYIGIGFKPNTSLEIYGNVTSIIYTTEDREQEIIFELIEQPRTIAQDGLRREIKPPD